VNHWHLVAKLGIHAVEGANAGDAAYEMAREHTRELRRGEGAEK